MTCQNKQKVRIEGFGRISRFSPMRFEFWNNQDNFEEQHFPAGTP
jgi:hypothetical protein